MEQSHHTSPLPPQKRNRPRSSSKPHRRETRISVNGRQVAVKAPAGIMLLYVLRDQLGLRGPRFGCGLAQCGACAVLADGNQILSCVTSVASVASREIVTLEGLADSYHGPGKTDGGRLHPLQLAWIDEQVPQCGYCQGGMIMRAAELLSNHKHPSTAEIKRTMNGHLCRCGTYNSIIRAIHRAAGAMSS
jgi:aerobic-type carbon monoxide dehydrogenase small subunit (CoxS/CutS family)